MTKTDHLAKAKDYIAQGEDYYRKAAEEIVAAKREGDLSNRVVAAAVGKSEDWVASLIRWTHDPDRDETPFQSETKRERRDLSAARKVIRERPEAIAEAIESAPPEAQRKIADKLIQSPAADPSLKKIAAGSGRQPREPKSPERKLGEAVFALWEVGELLMDEVPAGEAAVRMTALAEKAQRLSGGIVHLLGTGEFEDEFRALVEEVGADA